MNRSRCGVSRTRLFRALVAGAFVVVLSCLAAATSSLALGAGISRDVSLLAPKPSLQTGWGSTPTLDLAGGLSVTPLSSGATALQLAQTIVGPGISVFNAQFAGSAQAGGLFSSGASAVGLEDGVVLGSGRVGDVVGPNASDSWSVTNATSGNAALSNLSGYPTYDAALLSFDFVPNEGRVYFQYVFSSEEYNEYVNSPYNDVFAFFVNGVNCATVGASGAPVAVNTINNGNPLGSAPKSHPELFISNDLSDGGAPLPTEMDGVTRALVCYADVTKGAVNHMTIGIADSSDSAYDSNVFIRGGSVSTQIPAAKPLVVLVSGINSNTYQSEQEWDGVIQSLVAKGYGSNNIFVAATKPGGPDGLAIDSQSGNWDNCAKELHRQIAQRAGSRPVILIGHSMGGLIARAYADRWSAPMLAPPLAIIQLGTPNWGSSAAYWDWMQQGTKVTTAATMLGSPDLMFLWNDLHANPRGVPIYRVAGAYFPEPAKHERAGVSKTWAYQAALMKLANDFHAGQPNDLAVTVQSVRGGPSFDPARSYLGVEAIHSPGFATPWEKAGCLMPRANPELLNAVAGSRDSSTNARIWDYVRDACSRGGVSLGKAAPPRLNQQRPDITAGKRSVANLDTAPGWSSCLNRSVAFAGGCAETTGTLEGTTALVEVTADVGTIALTVTDAAGHAVPCATTQDGGVVTGVFELDNPGNFAVSLAATSGSPAQASLRVWDGGLSSLRLSATGQVGAGSVFTLEAAVFESETSSDPVAFKCNTAPLTMAAAFEGASSVALHDDGVAPDESAGDGVYSGSVAAPAVGPSARIAVTAEGTDSEGIAFHREAGTEVVVAEARAALSSPFEYRLEQDASGKTAKVLVDVPVDAASDCALSAAIDVWSGGGLVAQAAAHALLAAGQSKIITVSVPATDLFGRLAPDGSFVIKKVTLMDETDDPQTRLAEATDVLVGSVPPGSLAVTFCTAALKGSNPSASKHVVVSGKAISTIQPITGVEYSLDGGFSWNDVPAPADGWGGSNHAWELPLVLGSGSYEVVVRSLSASGPIDGGEAYVWFDVEAAEPRGTLSLADGAASTRSRWVTARSAVEHLAPPVQMRFSVDSGVNWSPWQPFVAASQVVLPPEPGIKIVLGQYRDSDTQTLELVGAIELLPSADIVAPVTVVHGVDEAWHSSPVGLSFTAVDLGDIPSGVARTEYRLDDGPWNEGAELVVPAPPGVSATHSVDYRSTDNEGNAETAKRCRVRIDTVAPVTQAKGVEKPWYRQPVTISFAADDPGREKSGVAFTEYKLDAGEWTQGTSLTIPAPPETKILHTVLFRSADNAGNREPAQSLKVGVTTETTPLAPPQPSPTYVLTPSVNGGHGTISPAKPLVLGQGTRQPVLFYPDAGHRVDKVLVDGREVTITGPDQYTFKGIWADHTIEVSFVALNATAGVFTVTPVVSGGEGAVSPAGPQGVPLGATPTFRFAPADGYELGELRVDGEVVQPTAVGEYTFPAVLADHTIAVTFTPKAGVGALTAKAPSALTVKRGRTVALPYGVFADGTDGTATATITIQTKAGKVVARKAVKDVPLNVMRTFRLARKLNRGTYQFLVTAVASDGRSTPAPAVNTLRVL